MSKTKETKAARAARVANNLAGMAACGFDVARAETSALTYLRATYKTGAAVKDEDKCAFLAGYIAARMNPTAIGSEAVAEGSPMLNEARRVLKMAGATSKDATKRRTLAQEVAYGAARKALSRLLDAAGLVTNDKRGGARKPRAGESKPGAGDPDATKDADAANTAVVKADAEKRIVSAPDIHAYAIQQATMLLAFIDGRKATDPATRKAVVAFHKAMMAAPAPR
jgi:hypothetical protein